MSRKPRVLIVDDNENAARTLAMMCELADAEVAFVTSGKTAIEKVRDFKPKLILLDIGMPEMNGYEVCRRIKEATETADTVIYANSGWSDEYHRQRSVDAGFDGYLVKPIQIDKLEKLISEL